MKNLSYSHNVLNTDYYIDTLNHSVDSSFISMADDIGDKLAKLEEMHLNISKLFTSPKYDPQIMDQFANEIDSLFDDNKNKIKIELENSIFNYIQRLELSPSKN